MKVPEFKAVLDGVLLNEDEAEIEIAAIVDGEEVVFRDLQLDLQAKTVYILVADN